MLNHGVRHSAHSKPLLAAQGIYEEAEGLYKRSLRIYEKVLGSGHPDVAVALNDLAMLYHGQVRVDPYI